MVTSTKFSSAANTSIKSTSSVSPMSLLQAPSGLSSAGSGTRKMWLKSLSQWRFCSSFFRWCTKQLRRQLPRPSSTLSWAATFFFTASLGTRQATSRAKVCGLRTGGRRQEPATELSGRRKAGCELKRPSAGIKRDSQVCQIVSQPGRFVAASRTLIPSESRHSARRTRSLVMSLLVGVSDCLMPINSRHSSACALWDARDTGRWRHSIKGVRPRSFRRKTSAWLSMSVATISE
mmetsp:Transcript_135182/g.320442  ORF Transcript_135182/g.320442 Transcript_135182/m.320442 type:complete len:234 (+) Transcript_135182:1933-2634(+)